MSDAVVLRGCPNCSSRDYKYADVTGEILEFYANVNYKRVAYGIAAHSPVAIMTGAVSGVSGNLKTSPLLACRGCNANVVCCPNCGDYLLLGDGCHSARTVYNCPTCAKPFKLSSREYKWDVAIGHNDYWTKGQKATIETIEKVGYSLGNFLDKLVSKQK